MRVRIIVIIAVVAIFLRYSHDRRLDSGFRSIQPQTPETTILQALGTPSWTDTTCTAYDTTQSSNCSHVLVYRSSFSAITHKYWLVFIDAAGNTNCNLKTSLPLIRSQLQLYLCRSLPRFLPSKPIFSSV